MAPIKKGKDMIMKKTILTLAVLTSSLMAQETMQGLYFGAGVGFEAMPKDFDNGMGLSVKGGTALNQVLEYLGAEAELTTSVIPPQYPGGKDINVFTMGAYATYTIVIPDSPISVRPKFGVILPNLGDDINSRDIALSTGIAGVMKVNKQLNAYVEYVNASEWMNNYMVGIEVGF